MSFFSRRSKGKHYQNGHNGSGHYQSKGLLGNLFNMMISRSGSHGHNRNQQYNAPVNQPYPGQMEPQMNTPVGQQALSGGSLNCRKCNTQIPAGSKFCLQCGERVSENTVCSCGQKLSPNAKFCLECGKKTNG